MSTDVFLMLHILYRDANFLAFMVKYFQNESMGLERNHADIVETSLNFGNLAVESILLLKTKKRCTKTENMQRMTHAKPACRSTSWAGRKIETHHPQIRYRINLIENRVASTHD